jgi:uncharacterized protein YqgC (DUF456 family)
MLQTIINILAISILVIFCLAGLAAIFFTTFGTLIILIGALLYALITGFSVFNLKTLIILFTLYFCGEVLEYIFVIMGGKKLGASNAAVAGAIVGGIFGAALGTAFFGIGLIPGTFFGIFLGAFLVELFIRKDVVKSLKAGTGGILGRVGSIGAKLIIAAVMFYIMFSRIFNF